MYLQTRIYRELVSNYRVPEEYVTILTQYKAQCSAIEQTLKGYGFEKPRVSTVVASQGETQHHTCKVWKSKATCILLLLFFKS